MSDTSLVFNLVARERVSETLGKVREKFNQVSTGIATGVAGALGVGVAQAMDMSAANAKLAAQLGVGPAKAAELSKVSANVYSNAWGDSTATVDEAIKGVYQNIGDTSGVKNGLQGATQDVLALSETFDVDLGGTTKAVGQLMKTGLAKDAGEAMDLVTWGMQHGMNASDDFLDTLNEYSPQFAKLGIDGPSAIGLMNNMMKAGVRDSDAAADAIKEFGLRAIDTSATVTQAYQGLGLDADDMRKKIAAGGPAGADAMNQVFASLQKVKDPIKQNQIGTALMGTQWEDTVRSILPGLDTTKKHIKGVEGSTKKMSDTLSDSPAKSLEKFKRTATTKLAEVAGKFVNFATDNKGVMEPLAYTLGGIALAVLAIRAGMVLWAAAQTVWAGATAIATGAQWLWNTALLASPITWIIIAIIALVVIIVLIATKTTWFQTIWHTVWGGIKTAFNATINWFKGVFAWFGTLPGKFAGWFGAAKDWAVSKFTSLVNWVKGLPGRIGSALSSLAGTLRGKASSAFQSMRDAASSKASALMSWAAGIPGRIAKAVGGMGSLLRDKGKNVIQGLWNGISSMGGWIWGKIKSFIKNNVVDSVTSFLHIGSPSKLMADEVGHWLPPGIAQGAEANRGVLDKTMQGLVDPQAAMPSAPLTTGMAPLMGASAGGGAVLVRFEMAGAEDDFHRLMRKLTRVKGRGNVQVAFGQ
jgi:hypothetical protein